MDSEDYDMAKNLKGEIQILRSAADAAMPLAALPIIGVSEGLDKLTVGPPVPSGVPFAASEHCRASVQPLNTSYARKEHVMLPCELPSASFPTFTKACKS